MRKFSLKLFKQGKKVITRRGIEVKELTHFTELNSDMDYRLVGVLEGEMFYWTTDGRCNVKMETEYDLFHPEGEMWVNLYDDGIEKGVYPSKESALINAELSDPLYIGTFKLTRDDD